MWLCGAPGGVSLNNLPTLCCTCTLKENTKVWSLGHKDQSWQLLGVCPRFSLFHNDVMKDDSACTIDDKPQNYRTRRSILFRQKLYFSTNIQYFSKTFSLILNQTYKHKESTGHWACRANIHYRQWDNKCRTTLLSQHNSQQLHRQKREPRAGNPQLRTWTLPYLLLWPLSFIRGRTPEDCGRESSTPKNKRAQTKEVRV